MNSFKTTTNQPYNNALLTSIESYSNVLDFLAYKNIHDNNTENNLNMDNELQNIIITEIRNLRTEIIEIKADNKVISNNIENLKEIANTKYDSINENIKNLKGGEVLTRWIISIIVAIFFGVITIGINNINNNIESVQQNNSMQIQRDVAQEFLNYKK